MLENYNFFSDKNEILPFSKKVFTKVDFEDFMSEMIDKSVNYEFYWRGMHEASIKLYNSCQRYYSKIIGNNDYEQYHKTIVNLVNYVANWNNATVSKYLEHLDVTNDPIAILSIMQHFGFPSPLLDFTENANVALYFASSNNEYDDENDDIRNFSAIYSIEKKLNDVNIFNEEFSINRTAYADQFLPLLTTPLLLISNENKEFNIGLNLNIINQEGLFIYSNSPTLSLEESIVNTTVNLKNENKINCWHIHKKFNHEIRLYLSRNFGIDDDFIYPNFNKMIEHYNRGKYL